MPSRRQERMIRLIREVVSDAIQNHLSDPRIEGLVSVTQVTIPADLRTAEVYLSILGKDEQSQRRTFEAIEHATNRIQGILARELRSRFCPSLRFRQDDKFKKSLETMRLIEEVNREQSEE